VVPGPREELGLDDRGRAGRGEPRDEVRVEDHGVLDPVRARWGGRGGIGVEDGVDRGIADRVRRHRPSGRDRSPNAIGQGGWIMDGSTRVLRIRVRRAQPRGVRREGAVGLELDVGQADAVAD
jgi:hypothetical protein